MQSQIISIYSRRKILFFLLKIKYFSVAVVFISSINEKYYWCRFLNRIIMMIIIEPTDFVVFVIPNHRILMTAFPFTVAVGILYFRLMYGGRSFMFIKLLIYFKCKNIIN